MHGTNTYLLDTHSLVWFFLGKKTLSPKAKKIITAGFAQRNTLIIPTLVLLEVFHLSLKAPAFDFPQFLQALKEAQTLIAPFDKKVLQVSYKLPGEINIHDRVIAATAMVFRCPIVTKDKILTRYLKGKVVW